MIQEGEPEDAGPPSIISRRGGCKNGNGWIELDGSKINFGFMFAASLTNNTKSNRGEASAECVFAICLFLHQAFLFLLP